MKNNEYISNLSFCNYFKNILKNKYARIVLIILFFCLVVISRRVDAITYPQFYAEDGVYWYSEAYSSKNIWEPFLMPKQGYFQTISRIGGFFGNLVDISYAPIIFNSIAIFLEILPAIYFLSSRFEKVIPKFYIRFLCSLAYLLLLGTSETHANITNSQWRLALLMFLIIIASENKKIGWKIFDNIFLLLAGLSGPFVFFALPVAIMYCFYKRIVKIFYSKIAILGLTFSIQLYSYFFIVVPDAMRTNHELGANVINFFKILSGNIFIRGILCRDYTKKITNIYFWDKGYLPIVIGIICISILFYIIWKTKIELKIFILFTFLIFFAALISPQATLKMPQWEYLAGGSGGRYYFLPRLAWIISLGWLFFNSKIKILTIFSGMALFSFIFLGLSHDWVFDKFHNYNFEKQVIEFKSMEKGEAYEFKIVPNWKMILIKK